MSTAKGRGLLNVDVTLFNLAYAKLDADAQARAALVDGVTRAFKGKLPHGQVQVEVLAGSRKAAVTIVEVTLVPRGDTSADHLAATFLDAEEQDNLRLLIAAAVKHAEGVGALADDDVSVSSLREAPQDGELQLTAADVEAGATVIPMDATTLKDGQVITIMEHRANGLQMEVTIVSRSGGDLHVAPALAHAFARGSMVILIPSEYLPNRNKVTDTVVLTNLPPGKLDDKMREDVGQRVQAAYAETLGVSPGQVDIRFKSSGGRRLLDRSTSTEIEVSVTPGDGQTADDLVAAMDANRGELDSTVQSRVQEVPGISDVAVGPIAAVASVGEEEREEEEREGREEEREFKHQEERENRSSWSNARFLIGGVVCLGCLAICAAVASITKAKREKPTEGSGEAQDEMPLATAESWLGPEPDRKARGPLRPSPPRLAPPPELPEEPGDQLDLGPPPTIQPAKLVFDDAEDQREELLRMVFEKFDQDGDSLLSEAELLAFATAVCEFGGNAHDWSFEYSAICDDLNLTGGGVGIDEFRQVVSDRQFGLSPRALQDPEAVSALYCSTSDLEEALQVQLTQPHM